MIALFRMLSGNPRLFNCRDESVSFVHVCTLFMTFYYWMAVSGPDFFKKIKYENMFDSS